MYVHVMEKLLHEAPPASLQMWAWQAMMASFPFDEHFEVWGDILEYLGWLDSWPVLEVNPTTGG